MIRTSAGGLGLIPLGVIRVHALDGDGPLLQGVSGVAGELHDGAQGPRGVAARQVAVLNEGLVAVARGEGCGAPEEVSGLLPTSKPGCVRGLKFMQE